jgi:hypothetical protein
MKKLLLSSVLISGVAIVPLSAQAAIIGLDTMDSSSSGGVVILVEGIAGVPGTPGYNPSSSLTSGANPDTPVNSIFTTRELSGTLVPSTIGQGISALTVSLDATGTESMYAVSNNAAINSLNHITWSGGNYTVPAGATGIGFEVNFSDLDTILTLTVNGVTSPNAISVPGINPKVNPGQYIYFSLADFGLESGETIETARLDIGGSAVINGQTKNSPEGYDIIIDGFVLETIDPQATPEPGLLGGLAALGLFFASSFKRKSN